MREKSLKRSPAGRKPSRRDELAEAVLPAVAAALVRSDETGVEFDADLIARSAYVIADAMLVEREQ